MRLLRPRLAAAPPSQPTCRHNPSRAAKVRVESYPNISDLSSSPSEGSDSGSDADLDTEDESQTKSPGQRPGPSRSRARTIASLEDIGRRQTRSRTQPSRNMTASFFPTDDPVQNRPTKRRRLSSRAGSKSSSSRMTHKTPCGSRRQSEPVGAIPPWETMPYEVLKLIFGFTTCHPSVNAAWMVDLACLCRAFAEPALAALHESPPLATPASAQRITELVTSSNKTMFNYRHKIKNLALDVGFVARSWQGHHLDFAALLGNLPSLNTVELYHSKDLPPYRHLHDNIRWLYPDSLFNALGVNGEAENTNLAARRLKGWLWSSRMLGNTRNLQLVMRVHQSRPFEYLRKVHFVNFQMAWAIGNHKLRYDDEAETTDRRYSEDLASCISILPNLEHLVLEASTVVNGTFLCMLPQNLKILEITGCWELTSEDFTEFLLTHGSKLEVLKLLHNEALSLGFLTVLSQCCPSLKELHINLNYYRSSEAGLGGEPFYNQLLRSNEVPQWPETLELLDIENMRQWERDAADMFFQSIANSAPRLPMLRYLSITARLTVPWRDRSAMRDYWVDRLQKIYLRPQTVPRVYHTLSDFKATNLENTADKTKAAIPKAGSTRKSLKRRSSRLAHPNSYKEPETDNSEFEVQTNFTSRHQALRPFRNSESDSELTELSNISDMDVDALTGSSLDNKVPPLFIQGKCNDVHITIDNQKTVEQPFGMDDFLDEEQSNESEWDGHDPEIQSGYAW